MRRIKSLIRTAYVRLTMQDVFGPREHRPDDSDAFETLDDPWSHC